MSHRPFDRSPDLKRLRDEGYNVEIKNGYLVMRDVPYVGAGSVVRRGFLAAPLLLAGDTAQPPDNHTHFGGEMPCDQLGQPIERIRNAEAPVRIDDTLVADRTFSAMPQPTGKYANYYDKFATYAAIVSGPAARLDPCGMADLPVVKAPEQAIFNYVDTATSRAEITGISDKLAAKRIAIVGLDAPAGTCLI